MADAKTTGGAAGNTAVSHGDHDRVVMLSLRADGTPDQHNPEIIGDKEFALEATREQFKQQAVSAVDQAERGVSSGAGGAEPVAQDPAIAALQDKHEAAEKAAVSAAESTVGALFTDDEDLTTGAAAVKATPATVKK